MSLQCRAARLLFGFVLLFATKHLSAASYSESIRQKNFAITPPPVAREFRGAWVTTVYNVDWPSKKSLTTAQQKAELIAILDRARLSDKEVLSSNHIGRKNPQLVRKHGQFLWLDPGDKAAQDYTLRVAQDIVRRYDIDGFQIDDYFYPGTQPGPNGKALDFD